MISLFVLRNKYALTALTDVVSAMQLTTITLPTQDKLSALPTATLMHCASQLLDPKCASNGSHSFASTVTLSTTSQFTTTSFCSAPFPQPFVSIQGKPIRYDDDDAGDATDSEMIAHRFDSGLRALSSWFAAFTAQCEIFATETKAAGVFPRRLFALVSAVQYMLHDMCLL